MHEPGLSWNNPNGYYCECCKKWYSPAWQRCLLEEYYGKHNVCICCQIMLEDRRDRQKNLVDEVLMWLAALFVVLLLCGWCLL